ncbi:MAG: hypothetical protein O3C15_07650 [Proteobacteria bacterium]|nr:hypothetical protein [Pseudomonadota bacterium]
MRRHIIAFIVLVISGSGLAFAQNSNADIQPSTESIERQMKAMQDMHQKMQSSMTATERAALLREHTELMHSSMAMLNKMQSGSSHGGATAYNKESAPSGMGGMMGMHRQMEHRVSMIEQLMQMMIDRERTGNK